MRTTINTIFTLFLVIGFVGLVYILVGCTSSATPTNSPWYILTKYQLDGSSLECKSTPEFARIIERAYRAVYDELIASRRTINEKQWKKPLACLFNQPEFCNTAHRPCSKHSPECARGRGCAEPFAGYLWASAAWPPLCRGSDALLALCSGNTCRSPEPPWYTQSWPEEPCGAGCRCATTIAEQAEYAKRNPDALAKAVVVEMHVLLRFTDNYYRVSHAPGSPDLAEIDRCWNRYLTSTP